jgi:predicted transcriptional regulator
MAETIKFTEEEVNSINQLRQEVASVFTQLGQVAIERKRRITEIDGVESQLLQKHSDLQKQEQELFKGLNEKYGDGNYDPTTGEFTPSQTEKTSE